MVLRFVRITLTNFIQLRSLPIIPLKMWMVSLAHQKKNLLLADLNNFVTGSVSLIRIHTQEQLKTPTR